jgi:DedD protein
MAFFKFRKGGDKSPGTRHPAESIEAMRKRARHRLIGAGVLVLAGVIGFPLLFDTQPRPIAVDIPIEIPDRDKVKPLSAPTPRAVQSPSVSGLVTVEPAPATASEAAASPKAPPAAGVETAAAKPEAQPEAAAEPKSEPKPAVKDAGGSENGARAQALLEGKPVQVAAAAPSDGRFVVQVGAFADPAKARAARMKVERAGLKTYTNVADTKDGKRVRVRVGPFATRAEADKAASKIKGLDLPAAILTL